MRSGTMNDEVHGRALKIKGCRTIRLCIAGLPSSARRGLRQHRLQGPSSSTIERRDVHGATRLPRLQTAEPNATARFQGSVSGGKPWLSTPADNDAISRPGGWGCQWVP
jgi:hypothetical protein